MEVTINNFRSVPGVLFAPTKKATLWYDSVLAYRLFEKKTCLEDNKTNVGTYFQMRTQMRKDALTHLICSPGFSHPALTSHQTLWNFANLPSLTEFLYAITDKAHHQLIEDVITTFTHDIIPRLDQFQRGTTLRLCN